MVVMVVVWLLLCLFTVAKLATCITDVLCIVSLFAVNAKAYAGEASLSTLT